MKDLKLLTIFSFCEEPYARQAQAEEVLQAPARGDRR